MSRWVLATLIMAVLFLGIVVYLQNRELRDSGRQWRAERQRLEQSRDSLRSGLRALEASLDHRKEEARALRGMFLDDYVIEGLQRAGLSDPVQQLRKDLRKHPELIPFKGVLGGTMGFYRDSGIALLNHRWVFAEFDDGHVGGSCLLEFAIQPDSTIKWSAIRCRTD